MEIRNRESRAVRRSGEGPLETKKSKSRPYDSLAWCGLLFLVAEKGLGSRRRLV